jgi:hypothetical protein
LGNRHAYDGPTVKPKSSTPDAGVPPLVRPGGAADSERSPVQKLIKIEGAPTTATKPAVHADPFAFWMSYYKTHDESAGELATTVRLLEQSRRMLDVEAVLRGYLWNIGTKSAEAWMYRALALAMKINQRSPADVRTALNYAADIARRTHNPNDLVTVADTMMFMGQLDRVGALLDEAAAKVPHRNETLKMSVNLSLQQKDPVRMGDAIEKLLALGWPGEDDYIRADCRRVADLLAKSLREEGREPEATDLLGRLAASETRDVYIRLTWDGYADFDLAVDEPLGVTASYELPRTVFGGSVIKNGFGSHPEETYVCPRGFDGDYTVHIRTIWTDPQKPVVRLKLETIAHEGTAQEQKDVYTLAPEKLDKTFVVHLSGGRRKTVLPYIDPLAGRFEVQAKGRPAPKKAKDPKAMSLGAPAPEPKGRTAPKDKAKPNP